MSSERPAVLYDGHCRLCTTAAGFAAARDPAGALCFLPFDTDDARTLLAGRLKGRTLPDSMIWVEGGRMLARSDAVVAALSRLPAPWCWLAGLRLVPVGVRDAVYDWIAAHRLRWFGAA